MPELRFGIKWPDGQVTRCWSPSTVVAEYFQEGAEMTVRQLREVSTAAFEQAGNRVQQRYGFACSSAADQLRAIQQLADNFPDDGLIRITDGQASP